MDRTLDDEALSEAFRMMPVTFKSLVIEYTTRCNAKCGMCYQAAGPKGSDLLGRATLQVADVERVIRDAVAIESLGRRFHIAGGEAFIKLPDILHLLGVARDAGFTNLSTTTNAFWARKPERAREVCRACREAGLTSMEISWDYWHVQHIPGEAVSNCLEACSEFGIASNLRLLTTKSHSVAEALSFLRPAALEVAGEISSCPVFPTGRARTEVPAEDIYACGLGGGGCHHMLNLTVNGLGNVSPCCAGADQTEGLSFGNIREQSIAEIVGYMQRSPLLRVLVFQGVTAIRTILEQSGLRLEDDYANTCHMCFDMFSSPERSAAVHDYFDRQVATALGRALEVLGRTAGGGKAQAQGA